MELRMEFKIRTFHYLNITEISFYPVVTYVWLANVTAFVMWETLGELVLVSKLTKGFSKAKKISCVVRMQMMSIILLYVYNYHISQ